MIEHQVLRHQVYDGFVRNDDCITADHRECRAIQYPQESDFPLPRGSRGLTERYASDVDLLLTTF